MLFCVIRRNRLNCRVKRAPLLTYSSRSFRISRAFGRPAVSHLTAVAFPSLTVVAFPSLTAVAFPFKQHRQDQPSYDRQGRGCSGGHARVERPGLGGGHFSSEVTSFLQGLDQRGMRTGTLVQHQVGQDIDVTVVQVFRA